MDKRVREISCFLLRRRTCLPSLSAHRFIHKYHRLSSKMLFINVTLYSFERRYTSLLKDVCCRSHAYVGDGEEATTFAGLPTLRSFDSAVLGYCLVKGKVSKYLYIFFI